MGNLEILPLVSWSAITAIFIVTICLVYRKFSRKKQDEPPAH